MKAQNIKFGFRQGRFGYEGLAIKQAWTILYTGRKGQMRLETGRGFKIKTDENGNEYVSYAKIDGKEIRVYAFNYLGKVGE